MKLPANIFLIGPMGAGKSAVGRQLARSMHLEFVDSDDEIESRTGVDIPFIFEKEGEEGFRAREVKVIDELSQRQGVVLATGGGAILDANSRNGSARGGSLFISTQPYSSRSLRTSRGRNRPLLENGDRESVLEDLMAIRDPLYREIADMVVDTDGRRVKEVANEITGTLRN